METLTIAGATFNRKGLERFLEHTLNDLDGESMGVERCFYIMEREIPSGLTHPYKHFAKWIMEYPQEFEEYLAEDIIENHLEGTYIEETCTFEDEEHDYDSLMMRLQDMDKEQRQNLWEQAIQEMPIEDDLIARWLLKKENKQ